MIFNAGDPDANIIFGATIDEKLQGDVVVTVIATGFKPSKLKEREALPFLRPRTAAGAPALPRPKRTLSSRRS